MSNGAELQEKLNSLEQELDQYKAAVNQIAQTVNDLNNLLAVMRGHAQLAHEDGSDQAQRDLIQAVLTSTARAQQLIRGALASGKITGRAAKTLEHAAGQRTAKVLVVDDEQLMRSLITQVLAKHGHEALAVGSGQAALDACQKQAFDIIFLDIVLGDMDGLAAFRNIREILPSARVVLLSGAPDIDEIQRVVRQEGADGFIRKPFDITEISNVVSYIMDLPVGPPAQG